jgi:hypothetical protein
MTETGQEKRMVVEYVQRKKRWENLDDSAKLAKKEFEAIQTLMEEYLTNAQKDSTASYEYYGRIGRRQSQTYASCKKENMCKLVTYLKEIGREDLIVETVEKPTIKSFVVECENKGEKIPGFVNVHKNTVLVHYKPR